MKTGEIIGVLAAERGINLRQLAIKADIPYNTLYAIVKRKSERIAPETLRRIATALDVPLAYLQGWDEAVASLKAAGFSLVDVAEKMDIPVELIIDVMAEQDPHSSNMAEKIHLVVSSLAEKNTERFEPTKDPSVRYAGFIDACKELGLSFSPEEVEKLAREHTQRLLPLNISNGAVISSFLTKDEELLVFCYRAFTDEGQQKIREYISDLGKNPKNIKELYHQQ